MRLDREGLMAYLEWKFPHAVHGSRWYQDLLDNIIAYGKDDISFLKGMLPGVNREEITQFCEPCLPG